MDFVFSSATQLAQAIRTGQVSARQVLEAHLAQIERHILALNGSSSKKSDNARVAECSIFGPRELLASPWNLMDAPLNAVVTLDAEHARQRAREADKALAQGDV